ncbi:TetR family transcriptional regulator [Mycobacterium kubicae]|uniref:TetR family transcriptional regulator n=1 Tax=Mycobacterium kubicae TaxID=120959 RepID=A0AAX1J8Q4_9MYCO|nr:TetR/AcrR family transcriptional regulator [Mycobacterium kubicae]MCV7097535.1 TetR/AcrR family transcriptional regulator [Mycobacterium kubicae]ORV96634.1 spore coat protein CotS [Mycobacterium kubicae]QNI13417.1 TetR/AcrR family transcriptional regulator [Mycobacterium kubicae]QPI36937.1 TetR/AcrR family transcriptional regulator [Mycobacterium kubicae]GFG67027.1 TetR family transcriptional regulator [Mycobacterium kubicae]
MARQVRSEATRRKILDAAVDVFSEVGYAAAAWGTIIERTGMTKGALYHHFDSKEALASDIINEGADVMLRAFRNVCVSASPALENMIHGTFAFASVLNSDKTVRAAEQLAAALSGFNEAAARSSVSCVGEMAAEARRAIAEGDLRDDVDPEVLSESIIGALFGTRLLLTAMSGAPGSEIQNQDLSGRLLQLWTLLLPGIVTEASLPYFRQFLAREAMRHARPAAPTG